MKKILYNIWVVALCCSWVLSSFSACKEDDDDIDEFIDSHYVEEAKQAYFGNEPANMRYSGPAFSEKSEIMPEGAPEMSYNTAPAERHMQAPAAKSSRNKTSERC